MGSHGRDITLDAVAIESSEDDGLATRVERECAEQGIPVGIDDPVTIAKILTLVRAGRVAKSATRAERSRRRGRSCAYARER